MLTFSEKFQACQPLPTDVMKISAYREQNTVA